MLDSLQDQLEADLALATVAASDLQQQLDAERRQTSALRQELDQLKKALQSKGDS